jgi:hypothetical protein
MTTSMACAQIARIQLSEFDVVISYTENDAEYAGELIRFLHEQRLTAYPDQCDIPWTAPRIKSLEDLYLRKTRRCIVLLSEKYIERRWRIPDRRTAMEKALARRGPDYFITFWISEEPNAEGALPIETILGMRNAIRTVLRRIRTKPKRQEPQPEPQPELTPPKLYH